MRNLILFALAIVTLTACSHSKKVTSETDIKTELKASSVVSTETNVSKDTKLDKAVTTIITEKIDTNVVVPSTTASVSRPLADLIDNKVIEASNGNTSISVTYDPTTGTVKATGTTAEHSVPIQAEKTTLVREDSKSSEHAKGSEIVNENHNTKSNTHTSQEESFKESSSNSIGVWIAIILFLILLIGVIITINRIW